MKKQVIVLNSHGVGQYAYCDHMPSWGETLSVSRWHIAEDGGKGSNVAVALGRLGIDTAFIGMVGNDAWGDLGEKWMQDAGVDTSFLYRTDEISTGTGLILISSDGKNAIIDGDSSSEKLTMEDVHSALNYFRDSEYLITGFEIPVQIAYDAIEYGKKLGLNTVLNPSPLPKKLPSSFAGVDYLFINEVEAATLGCVPAVSRLNAVEVAEQIRASYQVLNIVITLGADGAVALDNKGTVHKVSPVSVDTVVNTAGAGDGFMAATVACLSEGKSFSKALEWASAYAALCVTIEGTIPAYRPLAEVEAFIETHELLFIKPD